MPRTLSRMLAHIVADADEMLGHAMVPNGIPLSKIHHAAFDAHLSALMPITACMCRRSCWSRMTGGCWRD